MAEEEQLIRDIAGSLSFHDVTPEQRRIWKAIMSQRPQWYVLGKAVWKTDRWRAIAGPFEDQIEAQRAAHQLADDGIREGGQDIMLVYRTQVTSLTETMRVYQNNVVLMVDDLEEAEQRRRHALTHDPLEGQAPAVSGFH